MSAAGLLLAGYAVVGGPTSSFASVVTYSGSMEGNLSFAPGAWVSAGYHFSGGTVGSPVTFDSAQVTLPVSCTPGGSVVGSIVVPLASGPYTPASSGDVPWKGQSSTGPLTYQGAVQAPNLCKGGDMYNSATQGGASFSANVISQSSAPIQLQFHYSVPSAKNGPNTNCDNSSDPNAHVGSICGVTESCCFTICPHQPPSPPTTKPSPPTTKPSPPTTKPSPPTTKPSPPTTKPSPPTTKPSPPTTKPSPPTTQPPQQSTGSIAGHIYLCKSGAQSTTEVPGGTLAATGPQSVSSTSNPLAPTVVKAGDYTMSAVAPSGYTFVNCGGTATISSPPTKASESVTVPKCKTGVGTFYVVPTTPPPPPSTGSIAGHIYLCNLGSPSTTEVPGGTLATTGPQSVASTSNPLAPTVVRVGDYTMSAAVPSGYTFTSCGGTATIGSPATTATESVTVPVNGVGTGIFYVDPVITLTVTKANDANGSGTYAQTESANTPGQDVPFQVVVTNTAPVAVTLTSLTDSWPGQALFSPTCATPVMGTTLQPGASTTCDFTLSSYAPAAGGSLTDTVIVNGCQATNTSNCDEATAISTVLSPPATAPQSISLEVVKANDANGSGIYSQTEIAPSAGVDVPFEVLVTNTSSEPIVLTSLTDQWPGQTPFSPTCAATVVGTTLAPGATVTCDFTVARYSPAAGGSRTDEAKAIVCQATDTNTCASASAFSTVKTPPAPVTAAAKGTLAFTGPPSHLQSMVVVGLGTASAGFFFLWLARPRRKSVPRS